MRKGNDVNDKSCVFEFLFDELQDIRLTNAALSSDIAPLIVKECLCHFFLESIVWPTTKTWGFLNHIPLAVENK